MKQKLDNFKYIYMNMQLNVYKDLCWPTQTKGVSRKFSGQRKNYWRVALYGLYQLKPQQWSLS